MAKMILHVEDDRNDVLLLKYAMAEAGLTTPVQAVSDGQQAIDYLNGEGKFADRDAFPLPVLVLLDLKLPLVPGLQVLKWIRRHAQLATPVVVLTSSDYEADISSAYRLGASAYLVKPNEVEKLVGVAKAINDFWLTLNRPPVEAAPVEAAAEAR